MALAIYHQPICRQPDYLLPSQWGGEFGSGVTRSPRIDAIAPAAERRFLRGLDCPAPAWHNETSREAVGFRRAFPPPASVGHNQHDIT